MTMQNEMRDRLTASIENAKKIYEGDVTDLTETEYVAECLLSEGIIVPPCCGCETLLMSDALIEMSKKDAKNSYIKQLLLDKIFPFKGVDMKSYSINAYAVYVAINNILGGD
jgi:hypothetical protein